MSSLRVSPLRLGPQSGSAVSVPEATPSAPLAALLTETASLTVVVSIPPHQIGYENELPSWAVSYMKQTFSEARSTLDGTWLVRPVEVFPRVQPKDGDVKSWWAGLLIPRLKRNRLS